MAEEANLTVIGRSVIFRGDISGDSDVQIDGMLEGSLRIPGGRVTVGPEATVTAEISAKEMIVHGKVQGDVRCTGRTELRSTATLVGNVFSVRLSVEQGAVMQGRVDCTPASEEKVSPHAPGAPGAIDPLVNAPSSTEA